jgi:hypothetical protein
MIGGGFQHEVCSSAGSVPKLMEWVKGNHTAPISIHIDHGIVNQIPNKSKKNYAWLSESKTINNTLYKWVLNNIEYLENNFECVFTHDKTLLSKSNIFKYVICNAKPWVKEVGLHNKSKMISMIVSNKVMCEEHRYRLKIANKYRDKLDLYGRGFREIPNKDIGLKDYRFSIAIENGDYSLMYTEKITDCFAMGTIPIYWGCSEIYEVFDPEGIIFLTDNFNPEDLTVDLYESKIESIKNNYNITMNLPTAEDYIYKTYIK